MEGKNRKHFSIDVRTEEELAECRSKTHSILCGKDAEGRYLELRIEELVPFKNHPFKVIDNADMEILVDSINQYGVINPIIVRSVNRRYEIISGHRRVHAAKKIGLQTIPAIVKDMDDDAAVIAMVDSNNQREKILPSERAWSLKMRMDAIKHQGSTSAHNEPKLSSEVVGNENNISASQVKKYIRLTKLIPELLDKVDNGKITFVNGYEISGLNTDIQQVLLDYVNNGNTIKSSVINELKIANITKEKAESIIYSENEKKHGKSVKLKQETIEEYFPAEYDKKKIEKTILALLEKWNKGEIEI